MRYRLSTLLIIVAGIAIAFTQHASPVRFTIVATVELAMAMVWIAAKGFPFPWKAALALVAVADICITTASYWFVEGSGRQYEIIELIGVVLIAVMLNALLLLILLGLLVMIHSIAESYFWRDPLELRANKTTETRKSSD